MIYRVTYIRLDPKGSRVETITHPNLDVAKTVYDALKMCGVHVRLWNKDGRVILPTDR